MWFEDHLRSLKEPEPRQKIWKQNPDKLTILFVEGHRTEMCKYNLWNLAHIYGGTDVGLHIICSQRNLSAFKEYTKDWTNVVITWNPLRTVAEFSNFMTSVEFHQRLTSSHVLVTSWDAYIFRKIDEKYFEYDYVGAPFYGTLIGYEQLLLPLDRVPIENHRRVGNGGFSLRRVSACYDHCLKNADKPRDIEDTFLVMSDMKFPSVRDAYDFSAEHKIPDEEPPMLPVGMHKIWHWSGLGVPGYVGFGEEDFKRWCNIKT